MNCPANRVAFLRVLLSCIILFGIVLNLYLLGYVYISQQSSTSNLPITSPVTFVQTSSVAAVGKIPETNDALSRAKLKALSALATPAANNNAAAPAPSPAVVVPQTTPSTAVVAPSRKGPGIGLLCVILSASRPQGTDHLTALTLLLTGHVDRIAVYDADAVSTRKFPFVDVVVRGPSQHITDLVKVAVDDAANDKHHDPVSRIGWRSKNAMDYSYALEYAYDQREAYPYALVLEDDVWFSTGFADRIKELIAWKQNPNWMAWSLFHCKSFDKRSQYNHGDFFEIPACTQGLLYQSAKLQPLVSFTKANYREDPFDFLIRNWQYDTKTPILVVIPSIVQHTGGGGSTLKDKVPDTKTTGCHSFDFVNPTEPVEMSAEEIKKIGEQHQPIVVQMRTDGVPPDPHSRDRNI